MVPNMISRCFAHLIHWLCRMFGWSFNRPAPPDCSSRSDLLRKQASGHIYELYKPIDGPVELEILFFHGLQLGDTSKEYMTTWTNEKNELWPALWLPLKLPQARILSVSYDANIKKFSKQGRLDMYNLTENLTYDIGAAGIGQTPGCPVILVGHCFGGLVIKSVCVEAHKIRGHKYHHEKQKMANFLENLGGIFFYSTPHRGAPFADLASRLLDGPLLEYVTLLNENAARLDGEFCSACGHLFLEKKILSVGAKNKTEILKGFDVLMVPEGSARYGEYRYTLDADHFTICKPIQDNSPSFKILLQFIHRVHFEDQEKSMDIEFISSRKKFFVGLQAQVENVQAILHNVSSLGLYGMGGVGKTTLARAVYDKYYHKFDYSCWISDLRELVQKERGKRLRRCMLEGLKYHGREVAKENRVWNELKGKKVLLIVDNVDADHLLQDIPLTDWFGDDSKIIVTSRDKEFCKNRFKMAIEVQFLTDDQSLELFLHHAFEGDQSPSHVMNHVDKILTFCDGVPLAIETIARTLQNEMDEEIWESVIQKLKEGEPADGKKDNRLLNTLKVSYDRLSPEEQKIFLDSALPFMGQPISQALLLWKASWGRTVKKSWGNLISNCLVDLRPDLCKDDVIWVHETLRMLAQNIACPKHDDDGMCNWLVVCKLPDVKNLLKDDLQKPCKAEALVYESMHNLVLYKESISKERFPRLRILTLTNVQIEGDAIRLSPRLVYLKWSHANQTTLPFVLRHLKNLCWLELNGCGGLESIPEDVDGLTGLSRLELERCSSLTSLPMEIGMLTALVYLGAANSGLRELPEALGNLADLETLVLRGSKVSKLPDSVGKLKKLKVINAKEIPLTEFPLSLLNCVSITRLNLRGTLLTRLPESFGSMTNLRDLDLSHTRLEMLPYSFRDLGELAYLNLKSTPLRYLPEHIGNLQSLVRLSLEDTQLEELPGSIQKLEHLKTLSMHGCNKLVCLPDGFENLSRLEKLWFTNSKQQAISGNRLPRESLVSLQIDYCASLFDAHETRGFTRTDAIVQQETEQGRSSASMSDHSEGGKDHVGQFPPEETRIGMSCGSCGPDEEIVQNIRFGNLSQLIIVGNTNLVEFPLPLLHALPYMKSLSWLVLCEFHEVNCLPENIGDFLPPSLGILHVDGWRSLEELPESLGRVPRLQNMYLTRLDNLKRLPETLPDWPKLGTISVAVCKSLHGWPSRGLGTRVEDIWIDSWALMSELVEKHGHRAQLKVAFYVKREDADEVQAALRAWGREHPSSSSSLSSFSCSERGSEEYRGEQVGEVMEALRSFYGGNKLVGPMPLTSFTFIICRQRW